MRPLEGLVVATTALTLLVLESQLPAHAPWLRSLTFVPLLIAAIQVLVEGPRWQMAPAYGLAAAFGLSQPGAPLAGWLAAHPLAAGITTALGILGLTASVLLPTLMPVFRFPLPSGPYGIGTLTYHWVDATRQEILSTDPAARRELVAQIWYPAKTDGRAARAPYLPEANVVAAAFARIHRLPPALFNHFKFVRTNAVPAAPVADDEPGYPVLIYLPGLTGFRQMSTFQVEELVSYGYVVAAIDQPYTAASVSLRDGRRIDMLPLEELRPLIRASYRPVEQPPALHGREMPGGTLVRYLAQDAIFALDQLTKLNRSDPNGILTGRLDLQRAGVLGVSLGGIVAGEACRLERRLRACLVMDAPMSAELVRDGLRQPGMWITRDADTMRRERRRAGGWSEDEIHDHLTTMRAVFASVPNGGYFVQVPGAFHSNFMDLPKWFPFGSWLGVTGPIPGGRAHNIINAFSLAFFDRHLKGLPESRFDRLEEDYPEVRLETR